MRWRLSEKSEYPGDGALCREEAASESGWRRTMEKPREQGDEGRIGKIQEEEEMRETRDEGVGRGEFCGGTNGQATRRDERDKEERSGEDRLPVPGLGAPP